MLKNDLAVNIFPFKGRAQAFFVSYLGKSESDSVGAIFLWQNLANLRLQIIPSDISPPKKACKNTNKLTQSRLSLAKPAGPFLNVQFLTIPHQKQSFMVTTLDSFPQMPPIANFAINTFQ